MRELLGTIAAIPGLTDTRKRARAESKGFATRVEAQPRGAEANLTLPQGVTEKEAVDRNLLRLFSS